MNFNETEAKKHQGRGFQIITVFKSKIIKRRTLNTKS